MFRFINEYRFFTILFLILSLLASGLFGYGYYQRMKPKSPAVVEEEVEPDKVYEDALISEFGGYFNRSSGEIAFNWNYVEGQSPIRSVRLYHGDKELMNVTSYRSYNLNRNAYHIPTGDNEFYLKIYQQDGKVIERSISVFVNLVVDLEQIVTEKKGKTYVTLRYCYQEGEKIVKPTMIVLDSIDYEDKGHVGTKETIKNDMVVAETTYRFIWKSKEERPSQFSVRWSFEEISDSTDWVVDVENAKIVEEDKKDGKAD
jgi:hypothetical protein